tara:strand:+ start:6393 stop:7592 length:1200 start_codon:yes stop_codon:yes gene_type:complete
MLLKESIVSTCKFFIENKMYNLANSLLDSVVYNPMNFIAIHNEIVNQKQKGSYVILVESNGLGHITQMKNIIRLLTGYYNCAGIVIGRFNEDVYDFAKNDNIPLISLNEPEFVSNKDTEHIINDTIRYVIEFSYLHYKKVSKFICRMNPEFIINLHLPIKLVSIATKTVFNVSTQNRLDFDKDYYSIISDNKFTKFTLNSVIFSSYVVHNSYLNVHNIAIDSCESDPQTIPPMINNDLEISKRDENIIVCYFNIPQTLELYNIFKEFENTKFVIFIKNSKIYKSTSKNVIFIEIGEDFDEYRTKSLGIISTCGVETIYENFKIGLPMVCIPSNAEQAYNAYDHSRKISGFKWTYSLNKNHIQWLINFKRTHSYWKKHTKFTNFLKKKDSLINIIKSQLD